MTYAVNGRFNTNETRIANRIVMGKKSKGRDQVLDTSLDERIILK